MGVSGPRRGALILGPLLATLLACGPAAVRAPKTVVTAPVAAPQVFGVHLYDTRPYRDGDGEIAASVTSQGRGLAVAIAPQLLLTAAHVISEAGRPHNAIIIEAITPAATTPQQARIIAVHERLDLAILQVPQALSGLARLRAPTALDTSVVLPRLVERNDQQCRWYQHRLSTIVLDPRHGASWFCLADDEAHPGMSGGPVCAEDGSVLGIATSIGPFITQDGHDWRSTRFVGQDIQVSSTGALLLHGPGWRYPQN